MTSESEELEEMIEGVSTIGDLAEKYADDIAEEVFQNWIPGMGMTLRDADPTKVDQAVIDMLEALRGRIRDLQRQVGRDALAEGRFVRFPS